MLIVQVSRGESGEAALAVKVLLGRILPAVLLPVLAAGLGHRREIQTPSGDTLPVSPGVYLLAVSPADVIGNVRPIKRCCRLGTGRTSLVGQFGEACMSYDSGDKE